MPRNGPLNILALDGGGTRGIAELYCLEKVLSSRFSSDVRPCDIFDLIVGTSTGGIVAVLLGRLKLTIPQAIEIYLRLIPLIFSPDSRTRSAKLRINTPFGKAKYSRKIFEKALKDEIQTIIGGGELTGSATRLFDPEEGTCRTVLVATYKSSGSKEKVFRSYVKPGTIDAKDTCTIWEAVRASTAAPLYFSPMTVDGVDYWDGGLVANNPVGVAIDEAQAIWRGTRSIGCVLSLGTGLKPAIEVQLEGNMFGFMKDQLPDMVTSTSRAHDAAVTSSQQLNFLYDRFDAENTSRIPLDSYLESDLRRLKGLADSWLESSYTQSRAAIIASALRVNTFPGKIAVHHRGMKIPNSAAVGVDFEGRLRFSSLNEMGFGEGVGQGYQNGKTTGGTDFARHVVPGKYSVVYDRSYYIHNGEEHDSKASGGDFKVIVDFTGTQWAPVPRETPHALPLNAILFGRYAAGSELYVGRAKLKPLIALSRLGYEKPTSDSEVLPGQYNPTTGFQFTYGWKIHDERTDWFDVSEVEVLCYASGDS